MVELNVAPSGIYDIEWNGEPGEFEYEAQAGSQVDVVVTDDFGCARDTSFDFEAFPTFNYTLTNASIVCPGEPAFVTVDYNPSGTYTVLWNGEDGSSTAYTAEAGSPLSILITDANGCEKDTSITISSYPIFNVDVLTPAPSCPGESATINLSITPGPSSAYTIEWNGEVRPQLFYVTESGSEVSIEVTDVHGCLHDTTVVAEAFPEPVASFSIEQIGTCIPFEDSDNVTMTNNSVNGQTGTWNFGDGQTALFTPGSNVTHGYAEAGTYTITLEIMSADGCMDTTTQQICTLPEEPVFIPDIFSPNDDGKNDTLYVRGKFITRLEFRVYNRWGEVVFETNSVTQGWDGNVRGIPAQSGSYYYTITATVGSATRVEEVGEIVLIR
jgi:gliding motility-associated-like protein